MTMSRREVLGVAAEPSYSTTWERVLEAEPELIVIAPCGFDADAAAERAGGLDLPGRKVPMLLVSAVRLPLGLPKGIGAPLDALLLVRVHSATPPTSPRRQANPCRLPPQNVLARLGRAACRPPAAARRMANRPVRKRGSRCHS